MDNRCSTRYFNLLIRHNCNYLRLFEMVMCLACLVMGGLIWKSNVNFLIKLIITIFPFLIILICFFDVAARLLRNPISCVMWIIISLAAFLVLCLCAGLLLFLKRSTLQTVIIITSMIYLATALVFLFDYAWTAIEYCRIQECCCKVELPPCAQPCYQPRARPCSVRFQTERPFCSSSSYHPSVCSVSSSLRTNVRTCGQVTCKCCNSPASPRYQPTELKCTPNTNVRTSGPLTCNYACNSPASHLPNRCCPCGSLACNCPSRRPTIAPTNYGCYPKNTNFQAYQATVEYNSAFSAKKVITSIRPVEERFLQLSSHKSSGRSKDVADLVDESIFSFCGNTNKSEKYQLPQFKNKLADEPSNLDSKLKGTHCTRLYTVSEKDSGDLRIWKDQLWECPYCKMKCKPEPIDFSLQPSTSLDQPNSKIVRKDIRNNKVHPSPSNQEQKQTLACSKIPRPLNWWRRSKAIKTITKDDEYCPTGELTYRLDMPAATTYLEQEITPKRSVSHYSSREHVFGNKSGASTKGTLLAPRPSSTNLVYSNNRPPRGASICCRCATKAEIRLIEEGPIYVCCTCGKCK